MMGAVWFGKPYYINGVLVGELAFHHESIFPSRLRFVAALAVATGAGAKGSDGNNPLKFHHQGLPRIRIHQARSRASSSFIHGLRLLTNTSIYLVVWLLQDWFVRFKDIIVWFLQMDIFCDGYVKHIMPGLVRFSPLPSPLPQKCLAAQLRRPELIALCC